MLGIYTSRSQIICISFAENYKLTLEKNNVYLVARITYNILIFLYLTLDAQGIQSVKKPLKNKKEIVRIVIRKKIYSKVFVFS